MYSSSDESVENEPDGIIIISDDEAIDDGISFNFEDNKSKFLLLYTVALIIFML